MINIKKSENGYIDIITLYFHMIVLQNASSSIKDSKSTPHFATLPFLTYARHHVTLERFLESNQTVCSIQRHVSRNVKYERHL